MATSRREGTRASSPVSNDYRMAMWRCGAAGKTLYWQPRAPAWLDRAAHSLDALVAAADEAYAKQLRAQIDGDGPIGLCLPVTVGGARTWLEIAAERTPAGDLEGFVRDVSGERRSEMARAREMALYRECSADADAVSFEASLPTWRMLRIGAGIEVLTGYSHATWLSQSDLLRQICERDDRHRFVPASAAGGSAGQSAFVFRLRRADGRLVELSTVYRTHRSEKTGQLTARGLIMAADSDARIGLSDGDRQRQLRVLYDENPAMFFSLSPDGVVRSANKYGAARLGYEPSELVGMRIIDLHLPSQRALVTDCLADCVSDPGNVHHWQTCLTRRDGCDMWVRVTARTIEDEGRKEVLIVCEDSTLTRRLTEQLRYQANYDLLTGLANRQRFEKDLEAAALDAAERGGRHVLCHVDLDHFKLINDVAGHDAGDKLLLHVARLLARHTRENDLLARLGGDEFGIVYCDCDLEDALERATQVCATLAGDRFEWGPRAFRVTASIGVVDLSATSGSHSQLLSLADTACFTAKDQGRDRVVVYETGDSETARRHGEMAWASRLQAAVDSNGFELFCQSIRPLDEQRREGIEILLRLPDGDAGRFVQPETFLRAAENYQLAVRMDRWVCDQVLGFFETRQEYAASLALCCVNLSSQTITDKAFLDYLVDRIGPDNPVAPSLCFEITETGVIANLEQAITFITTLQALGCRFALDDFGSGVSSFAYLKELPVDVVKIDGMFVRNAASDPIDRALVASINDISHAMGKLTIAEYVDNDTTLATMREIGVDFVQGFHLAEPQVLAAYFGEE